jgi:hypothetical protein
MLAAIRQPLHTAIEPAKSPYQTGKGNKECEEQGIKAKYIMQVVVFAFPFGGGFPLKRKLINITIKITVAQPTIFSPVPASIRS